MSEINKYLIDKKLEKLRQVPERSRDALWATQYEHWKNLKFIWTISPARKRQKE